MLVQTDAQRQRVQPRRAAADDGRVARADDRPVPAARRRARAAGRRRVERARQAGRRSSWIRYTGEILALANYPTFNPERLPRRRRRRARNRAIQDLYEPGSTFKIVTASAAFEEKRRHADDDHRRQRRQHPVRLARDQRRRHNYGVLTFTDVIVKSSNVGAIKVGAEARARADRATTCGASASARPTRPTSAARAPGIVWDPSKLNDSALASVAMGYQVGVTPLQMAAAVSVGRQRRRAGAAARGPRGDSRRPAAAGAAQSARPRDQRRRPRRR